MSRFAEPQDPVFRRLNTSAGFDWRLAPYDIAQSRAHAAMLAASGIITDSDRDELHAALDRVAEELDAGEFTWQADDEDVHMAIERRVTEIAGHGRRQAAHRAQPQRPGRDRHDDVRARARAADARAAHRPADGARAASPRRHLDWPMPGYTHLQRAQPVYLSHHLLAYFWMFRRDARRFEFVLGATDQLPLGAGALAGRQLRHRPAHGRPGAGLRGGRAELDRRRLEPRLRARLPGGRGDLRDAPVPARRGARAVVERGVRLRRGLGRVGVGVVDHAAEEEPRRGGAPARQGAARGGASDGASRRPPRPAADLQQGPPGGQGGAVRRRRHARPVPGRRRAGCSRASPSTARRWRRPPATS